MELNGSMQYITIMVFDACSISFTKSNKKFKINTCMKLFICGSGLSSEATCLYYVGIPRASAVVL